MSQYKRVKRSQRPRLGQRLRDFTGGTIMPFRCVWAGHRFRPNPPQAHYAFRCERPGCTIELTPAGVLW